MNLCKINTFIEILTWVQVIHSCPDTEHKVKN